MLVPNERNGEKQYSPHLEDPAYLTKELVRTEDMLENLAGQYRIELPISEREIVSIVKNVGRFFLFPFFRVDLEAHIQR